MPIPPNDPNDPNKQPEQVDLNKLFNFEEAKRNIDHFFQELVDKLKPASGELFSAIKKESEAAFDELKKSGVDAFKDVAKASTDAFHGIKQESTAALTNLGTPAIESLKEVGETGRKEFDAVGKVARKSAEEWSAGSAARLRDSEEDEDLLAAKKKAVDAVVAREEKKDAQALHSIKMKYMKMAMSSEQFAARERKHDQKLIIDGITDEYAKKRTAVEKFYKDEKERIAEVNKLRQEEATKKFKVRADFKEIDEKVKREASPFAKLGGGAVAIRAKDDLTKTLLGVAEKFSSVAFILGGVAGVLMKLFAAGQAAVIRGAKQQQISYNVSGKTGTEVAQKAFNNINEYLVSLGMEQEQIQKYIETISEAPNALKALADTGETTFEKLTNRLGAMGLSAEESAQLIARASTEWAMGADDIIDLQEKASAMQKITGLRASDTMNAFINLNAQLRSVSSNTRNAATLMALTSEDQDKLKKKYGMSQTEGLKYQQKLADVISSSTIEDIAAMRSMTLGPKSKEKIAPSEDTLAQLNKGGGMVKLWFDSLLAKMGGKVPEKTSETGALKLSALTGFQGKELLKLMGDLRKYSESGRSQKSIDKLVKDSQRPMEDLQKAEEEGRQALIDSVDISQHLSAIMDDLVTAIAGETGLTNTIRSVVSLLGKLPFLKNNSPLPPGYFERQQPSMDRMKRDADIRRMKNLPMRRYNTISTRAGDQVTFTHPKGNPASYE